MDQIALIEANVGRLPRSISNAVSWDLEEVIGTGGYGVIFKASARWVNGSNQVVAIKYIDRRHIIRGTREERQLMAEAVCHEACSKHSNVLQLILHSQVNTWSFLVLELAEGGDLFDKIEAEQGVDEDVAHFYFRQLISAVEFIHNLGVAHRDIKPENLMLDKNGNLKVGDFGLAAVFQRKNVKRLIRTPCGSPPYVAPEIISGAYYGDQVDIWACGIVLFALICGATPWDAPNHQDPDYDLFAKSNGRSNKAPWNTISPGPLSLLRGILRIDTNERFSLSKIKAHPWYTNRNSYMDEQGKCCDPLGLAQRLTMRMNVDLNADPLDYSMQYYSQMDIPTEPIIVAMSQPAGAEPISRSRGSKIMNASQPAGTDGYRSSRNSSNMRDEHKFADLVKDMSLLQFTSDKTLPTSMSQMAHSFLDFCPAAGFARFYSKGSPPTLVPIILSALHVLGIAVPTSTTQPIGSVASQLASYSIRVRTTDLNRCSLQGDIIVKSINQSTVSQISEVMFKRSRGDPIQWRILFKRVAILCKEHLCLPVSSF